MAVGIRVCYLHTFFNANKSFSTLCSIWHVFSIWSLYLISFSFSPVPMDNDTVDWKYQTVPLVTSLDGGEEVVIRAEFTPRYGAAILDEIKITTRQHCFPRWLKDFFISGFSFNLCLLIFTNSRWIEVPNRQLVDNPSNQPPMSTFENSEVDIGDLETRHYIAENVTASLSKCAQYCFAGSGTMSTTIMRLAEGSIETWDLPEGIVNWLRY